MPAKKSKKKTKRATRSANPPSRPIWKGGIQFGLVNVPVALYSGETSARLDFDLLDRRDLSRVRYRRVNETTGREVPWDEIVKGYQYEKGRYVALSDSDFVRANVKATQTIETTDFVDAGAISPTYYDTPYYLEPLKNGRRAYALLREVLKKTGKVGVATVVLRNRQHLAVLLAQGSLLILNLVRFLHELRASSGLDLPQAGSKSAALPAREIKMAEQLVEMMAGEWHPEKYRDQYREDLLKIIAKKIKDGKTNVVESGKPAPQPKRQGKVIDIMHLLRQSVQQADRREAPSRRRKAG